MGILTEEELKDWEEDTRELLPTVSEYRIKRLINAYRFMIERNQKLVSENDEVYDDVEKLKSALTNISQVDYSNWHDDANHMKSIATKVLEEFK